jgi:hypothetical protein
MLDGVQKEIDGFYGRYASKEGISINEAKKRVTEADIKAYERKAKRYVKDASLDRAANKGKTNKKGYYFSEQANEEMRLYNLTMKVNRLEMLKANIGLDLIKGHDELEKYMAEILQGRTTEELERQAGILGNTITINSNMAHAIPNSSFHNAKFSDRIWTHQDLLKADLSKLLQTGLIQGKNPRVLARELESKFNTSRYNAERLMRAKKSGIYYTFPNDDTLKGNVMNVTGGKMADGAVYLAFANRCEPSVLFPLVKRDAYVAFCSLMGKSLHVNLEYALKNNVTIKGITESREFVSTAINLLANKAVNYAEFPVCSYKEEELPELMEKYASLLSSGATLAEQYNIIKFIF